MVYNQDTGKIYVKDIFNGEYFKMICKNCNATAVEILLSATNSKYIYCSKCETDYEIVKKHMTMDSILKIILDTLSSSSCAETLSMLKIKIKKEENSICLYINNKKEFSINSNLTFSKDDEIGLGFLIDELIQDSSFFNNVDTNVSLSLM